MPDVSTSELQRLSQMNFGCDWPCGLRKATGLNSDPGGVIEELLANVNPNTGSLGQLVQAQLISVLSSRAVLLPGTSGNYVSTPDHASLDIAGDLDVRMELQSVSSTEPLTVSGLWAKWDAAGNQRSYRGYTALLFSQSNLENSTTGANTVAGVMSVSHEHTAALRWTLALASGTKTLFTAPNMDGTWTQIGQVVSGATTIFASTAALVIGSDDSNGTSNNYGGRVTRFQVRDGINGTIVANPDFRNLALGTTSFADSTGKTWTLQGSAAIV